jgi:DNA-binding GntR family transcriptional regulator
MNQLTYQRLVERTVADPKRLTESDREHHKVLEAIRQKDPYGAEMAMRDHVHASSRAALYRTFGNAEATEATEDTAETEEQQ